MKRKLFNSEKEYIKWAKKVEVEGDGLARGAGRSEAATSELLENKPVKYPCVTVYAFMVSFDRSGDSEFRLFEHVYLAEFTEGFNPRQAEDEYEAKYNKYRVYFYELQKLGDMEKTNAPYEDCEKQYRKVRKLRNQNKEFLALYLGTEIKPIPKEYKRKFKDG